MTKFIKYAIIILTTINSVLVMYWVSPLLDNLGGIIGAPERMPMQTTANIAAATFASSLFIGYLIGAANLKNYKKWIVIVSLIIAFSFIAEIVLNFQTYCFSDILSCLSFGYFRSWITATPGRIFYIPLAVPIFMLSIIEIFIGLACHKLAKTITSDSVSSK